MGDHAQAFHVVKVFLDLWVQGDGAFPWGHVSWDQCCDGVGSCIYQGICPMPVNQSGNSFIKSSVDLMDLAAVGTVAGLTAVVVVETGARCGGFVPGCMTVMAQFFTTASFSLEGRPRMAGPGVSVVYQYEFTQWGQAPGQSGPPGDGTMECSI